MTREIVVDVRRFDFEQIIPAFQSSYWGEGRKAEDIRRAFERSKAVGVFDDGAQVAVARAITDGVFYAYVYDLIVFEAHGERGLARVVFEALLVHPDLAGVTGWMLSTRDAHGIYEKYGFERVDANRVMWMRRTRT